MPTFLRLGRIHRCGHFSPRLCAVRLKGGVRKAHLVQQLSSSVPTVWPYLFRSTCLISGLEIMALVAFLEESDAALAVCCIWIYMGSNNSLSAMTRGDSNTAAIAVLVSRAWGLIRRRQIRDWFSRIPSELNPADLPTRVKRIPFGCPSERGFSLLPELFRLRRMGAEPPPGQKGCRVSDMNKAKHPRFLERK